MSVPNKINATIDEINKVLYPADIHLNVSQAESIIGDSTWRSPSTYVQVIGTPTNFTYTGGQIVYTGTEDIHRALLCTVTYNASTANTTIAVRGGKNGVSNADFEGEQVLTNANESKELTINVPFDLSTNDTVDYFVNADKNVTIEKAVWIMNR